MAFIKEGVLKKYSVMLPYIGGAISLGALVLQTALDNQMVPIEYQVIAASIVLPGLAHLGRKLKQTKDPEPTDKTS